MSEKRFETMEEFAEAVRTELEKRIEKSAIVQKINKNNGIMLSARLIRRFRRFSSRKVSSLFISSRTNSSCFCVPFSWQTSEIFEDRNSCLLAFRICVQRSSFILGVIIMLCCLLSGMLRHRYPMMDRSLEE